MDIESDIYEVLYCPEDGESRVYCEVCDKLCIERYCKNDHKSGTHTNNFYRRQGLKDSKKVLVI